MDLDNLFKRAFDGFGAAADTSGFPGFPGSERATGNSQDIDCNAISRCSGISRSKTGGIGSEETFEPEKNAFDVSEVRANVSPEKTPGNLGNPGKETKELADTATYLFPEEEEKTGNPGKENGLCGRPILDLNRAAPQRSDWWTGPAMVEVDALQAAPLPITPAEVRAGVDQELRDLARFDLSEPEALRRAIAITAAKIRNSSVLVRTQTNEGLCFICGAPNDNDQPVVSVMQAKRGRALAMHGDCHPEHVRRVSAEVERIMMAAGYGAEQMDGEAA